MKNVFFGFGILIFLSGCTVNKYLQVTGGSKADGTITMQYEYGGFEKPVVQWDQAKRDAIQRCQAWGYSNAQFFDSGTSTCLAYNNYGCVRWRITYTCQCVD
jgi:hypothetical protein